MTSVRTAAVSEAQFWDLVKQIGWGTRTTDYKAIKASLMTVLSQGDASDLFKTFNKVQNALMKAITKWEEDEGDSLGVGDDGFSDLTAHIIGLGKQVYDKILKNPALAKDIKYVESFAYGFPYGSDYSQESPGGVKYEDWAERVIGELESYASAEAFKSQAPDARKLIKMLQLLVNGDTQGFLATEGEAKALSQQLSDFYENLMSVEVFHNKWGVWNLFSDIREKAGRANHLKLHLASQEREAGTHALAVGDIMVSSWGYDQTNVSWYQVVGVMSQTVALRKIEGKRIGSEGTEDIMMPVIGMFRGPAFKKRVRGEHGHESVSISNYEYASRWNGKPQNQTNSMYGH